MTDAAPLPNEVHLIEVGWTSDASRLKPVKMSVPLDPPPWNVIGGLLSSAAIVYAALFALAIATSFWHRSTILQQFRSFTVQPTLFLAFLSDIISRNALPVSMVHILLSTTICILYVFITYIGYIPASLRIVQAVLGLLLLIRLVFKIFCSVHPVALVVGPESVMDVISLSSLIFAGRDVWLNFSFLQAYIVLARYFHIEGFLEALLMQKTSPFRRQLARLALEFVVFVYVFACGLQLFEVLGDPTESLTATTFELTLANSLYFTVVTIFTVGYGDFVPYTLFGRLWIIFIIVVGAILVTRKIGQVIDVVSSMRRGMGSFVKDDDVEHCVLCGNIKWEYLKTFVQEFFADDRNTHTKVVVICDNPNWTEVVWNKFITTQAQYRHNVVYLEGTCMTRDDLLRAQVETALAIFVLCNQHDPNPYLEDSETLKRILTLRTFAPNKPIYAMCALRDSMLQITVALQHQNGDEYDHMGLTQGMHDRRGRFQTEALPGSQKASRQDEETSIPGDEFREQYRHAKWLGSSSAPRTLRLRSGYISDDDDDDDDDDDFMLVSDYDGTSDLKSDALCMQDAEMSLLAENVFCNGLSTLLSNLVLNVLPQAKPSDRPWMVEYKIGAECRLAYVKLPMDLQNMRFSDIAVVLYDYGILLLATKRFSDTKWRTATPETIIHLNTIGLVVTFHSAQFIEKVLAHATDFLCAEGCESNSYESSRSSRGVPSAEEDGTPPDRESVAKGPGTAPRKEDWDLEGAIGEYHCEGQKENSVPAAFGATSSAVELSSEPEADTVRPSLPQLPVLLDLPDALMSTDTLASRSIDADLMDNESILSPPQDLINAEENTDPNEELHRLLGDVVAEHVASSQDKHLSLHEEMFNKKSTTTSDYELICDTIQRNIREAQQTVGCRGPSNTMENHAIQTTDVCSLSSDQNNSACVKEERQDVHSLSPVNDDLHGKPDELDAVADVVLDDGDEIVFSDQNVVSGNDSYESYRQPQSSVVRQNQGVQLYSVNTSSKAEEVGSGGAEASANLHHSSIKGGAPVTAPPSNSNAQGLLREGLRVSFPVHSDVLRTKRSASAMPQLGSRLDGDEKLGSHRPRHTEQPKGNHTMNNIVFGDSPLPAKLKNHIVVCVIGQMGVVNLRLFLDRVWMRRRGPRRETPVVAICPKITAALEDDISLFRSNRLFVLQGNSLSISTLKRAQFDKARAIVVLACEDKNDLDHMDAQAIFTIMTLDYMLGESSNIFVCAMLDAEESMQLLRAPAHPRRRGVDLGCLHDELPMLARSGRINSPSATQKSPSWMSHSNLLQSPHTGPSQSNPLQQHASPVAQNPDYSRAMGGAARGGIVASTATDIRRGDTFFSFGGQSLNSFVDGLQSTSAAPYVGGLSNMWTNRSAALQDVVSGGVDNMQSRGLLGNAPRRLPVSKSFSFAPRIDEETNLLPSSSTRGASAFNFLFNSASYVGEDHLAAAYDTSYIEDRSAPPGLDRNLSFATGIYPDASIQGPVMTSSQIRDELFERQRYASGEMMISSVYVALLIREFAMPGIMSVVRKIFGADVGKNTRSRKCWIRTQKIPQKWVLQGVNGQRTYRELFVMLISLGCVPLGLYRSGEAMVRVQLAVENESRASASASSALEAAEQGPSRPFGSEGALNVETSANVDDELGALFPEGIMSPRPVPDMQSYTCPTTGRVATFEQVSSGGNVLPYVYTNPEPYTLVSEHDAVYILAHPLLKITQDSW